MKKRALIISVVSFLVILFISCKNLIKEPEIINNKEVKQLVLDLLLYGGLYSTDDVKVLDWVFNEDMLGDNYTGYIVTYQVGEIETDVEFVLANVVEFDNSNMFEVKILYHGASLSEITEYLE